MLHTDRVAVDVEITGSIAGSHGKRRMDRIDLLTNRRKTRAWPLNHFMLVLGSKCRITYPIFLMNT